MYRIDNYRKRAVDKIIPYLIEFPQIIKIIETSADRYQAIEDLLWNISDNLRVDEARGVFLNALAHNEVINLIYTDKADDAFTYGTDRPLYEAYGTGHYYGQASYISGTRKNFSEDKLIRAVKAKIIQNNTNATIQDFIEAMKLIYNAERISILESNPLKVSIVLQGDNLEVSSSGNYENIKKMLPICVNLDNIYLNHNTFDMFKYNEYSSYGDNRFPIIVKDTVDVYSYYSNSVNLNSLNKEYIKTNHTKLDVNEFCCIAGMLSEIHDDAILFSSNDNENLKQLTFGIKYMEDNEPYFVANYGGEIFDSGIKAELNKKYTFLIYNSGEELKIFVISNINIKGQDLNQDLSLIYKRLFQDANITISNYLPIEADIYINCINNKISDTEEYEQDNFGDFDYYTIIFGTYSEETLECLCQEYYVSCFGEKHILFNCFENKNHLYINTESDLATNLYKIQPYFNYKYNHANGKYLYFDGKSNITYNIIPEDAICTISDFTISFDFCCPIGIQDGVILGNFINSYNDNCTISLNSQSELVVSVLNSRIEDEDEIVERKIDYLFSYHFDKDKFYNVSIVYNNNALSLYVDDKLQQTYTDIYLKNIPHTIHLGSNNDNTQFFKGFVKNLNILINGIDENEDLYKVQLYMPLLYRLNENIHNVEYTNNGARFLTTPQLITNDDYTDLYNNYLLRNKI